MLISATGRMIDASVIESRTQRGVTLVEILIVLMIAALVAGVVVLNAPPSRSDAWKTAEKFAAYLDHMAQDAVTTGALTGMRVSDSGYEIYRYHRGAWGMVNTQQQNPGIFPSDFAVEIILEDAAKKNEREMRSRERSAREETSEAPRPNVTFTPTGQTTPLEVVFHDRQESIRVRLDGAGNVELSRDENT